jgi:hypothetical protein
LNLIKTDYLVEFASDFHPLRAQDRAIQVNVLSSGQLGMESRTDFRQ